MPLKSGKSRKTISKNIKELSSKKPGKTRNKAVNTLAKRKGITKKEAQRRQAIAIALQKANRKRKK